MLPNIPDWMPFACLITGSPAAIMRKAMLTRIIESVLTVAITGAATLYFGLPMAMERAQASIQANAVALQTHIEWARDHVSKRDAQMIAERAAMFSHDAEILDQLKATNARLERLYDCVAIRSCTK